MGVGKVVRVAKRLDLLYSMREVGSPRGLVPPIVLHKEESCSGSLRLDPFSAVDITGKVSVGSGWR